MDLVLAGFLSALGLAMSAARAFSSFGLQPFRRWADEQGHLLLIAFASVVCFVLVAGAASSAWRDGFPRINELERINVGDYISVHCREDPDAEGYERIGPWPGTFEQFDAQVIAEESPGVFRLGAFADMMAGKVSFEEFFVTVGGVEYVAEELPGVQLKDFGDTWPLIGPDVSAIYMTRTPEGIWSINSETRWWRYGSCGGNNFAQMTGNRIDVTWDEAEQAFVGTSSVTDLPGFCYGRRWNSYRCEPEHVICQDYCAYLSEYDGRWEVKADRMRKWVEIYGETLGDTLEFFVWQLAKLETYTDTNACTQAGDDGSAPPIKFAQCEIVQEMISANLSSPTRLSVWVPQYQRVGCPCADDGDGNGLPDYFDGAPSDCPEVAIMPETTAHDAYLIPVPEPSRLVLLAGGIAALAGLARLRRR